MRKASLMNASLLAIAAMLVGASSQAARAQSFNATAGVVAGSVAIDVATPGQTTVTLNSPVAVIDWRTNEPAGGSGPIIFQPLGTTATYINGDASNFTVLNRILPNDATRPVQFNGTVLSRLRDFPSPPAPVTITRGGSLFFYSPGGILVGATGVFDVGSLVLTASDLTYDPVSGDFGSAGTYKFLQANPGSSVEVRAGAQITASQFNSYVALVAPKVVNAGTITVDGSAVLVAADASTITFRPNGLFDIQIDQGTSDKGEVVTNTGTITGAAGSGNTAHRIYVVAVPKNDAITLAIKGGSKLGFDIAGAADVVGNAIVLSAGYDVAGGEIGAIRSAGGVTDKAALTIGAIEATSQVTGRATGAASIQVLGGADASFASNVSIAGTFDPGAESSDGAFVSVSGVGSTLDITGDFAVTSLDTGIVLGTDITDSGVAQIAVNRGTMTVDGNVQISASRIGFNSLDAVGGEASFLATNGASVTIGQALTVTADGTGLGVNDSVSIGSFPGVGGTAQVSIAGGATVGIAGNLKLSAAGFGGAVDGSGFAGANGTGGTVMLEGLLGGGTLTVTGTTLLDARGVGAAGFSCGSCSVEGGTGTGGFASLSTADGTRLEFGQAVVVDASGLGGAATANGGKAGGAAVGGQALLQSFGGMIIANAGASVLADGTGGAGALTNSLASGFPASGGEGGSGIGGSATLSAGADFDLVKSGSIAVTGDTLVSASGTGGNGGAGGTGLGGAASVSARDGDITGAGLSNRALGLGGSGYNGGAGGAGRGGNVEVIAYSAVDGDSSVTFGTTAVTARGSGGAGSAPEFLTGPGGTGGAGIGGVVSALAEAGNGALQFGATTLNASGEGGAGGGGAAFGGIPSTGENGGAGGLGRGGFAKFGVVSGTDTGAVNTGSASFAGATVSANGNGGAGGAASAADVTPGVAGQGGNAFGGGAALVVNGGTVSLSAAAQIQADALGGNGGGSLGAGGDAFVGGTVGGDGLLVPSGVRLEVGSRTGHADQAGALTGTALTFSAAAEAGKGGSLAAATNLGRPLAFLVDGGTITAGSLDFQAAGIAAPGAQPSAIALMGGDTTLSGTFNFATPGALTAALGGAELFSATTVISASNWLPGPVPAATPGTLHGSTSVTLLSDGDLFANLSVDSGGSLTLAASGLIRLDNLTATDFVLVDAGTTLTLGNIVAGTAATLTAAGDAAVGSVNAGGDALLNAAGAFSAGAITSRQSIRVDGAAGVTLGGDAVAGSAITLVSDGAISGAGLSAGLVSPSPVSGASYDITVFGKGAVTLGNLSAAHDIKLLTPLDLTVGALTGRDMAVLAGGKQTIGYFVATGRVLLADYEMTAAGGEPLGDYDLNALFAAPTLANGGSITVLASSTAGSLTAATASDLAAKAIGTTGAIALQAGGAIAARAMTAGGAIAADAATTMKLTSASAGDLLTLRSGGAMTTGNLSGTNGVSVTGLGAVTTGTAAASAGGVTLAAATDLASGAVTASGPVSLATIGGGIAAGDVTSSGSTVAIIAAGPVSAGNVLAASGITASAAGNLALASASSTGGDVVVDATGAVTAGDLGAAGGRLLVTAGTAATLGDLSAAGLADGVGLRIDAGTSLDTGSAAVSAGELRLTSTGAMTTGDLVATGGALVVASGGALDAGALGGRDGITLSAGGDTRLTGAARSAAGDVALTITGALNAAAITADTGVIGIAADTGVTTGALTAAKALTVSGGDALDLGDLQGLTVDVAAGTSLRAGTVAATGGAATLTSAGDLTTGGVSAAAAIALTSTGGSVTASGAIDAATDAALFAANDLSVGDVAARDMLLLAGGNVRAANLASPGGRILVAGAALAGAAGAIGEYDFDAVFAAPLQAAGGSLSVTGAVSGGAFTAAVKGDAGLLGIDAARSILVDSGGTVRLGGVWKAPVMEIRANDLVMPAGSGLDAGLSGMIRLVSRNASGMRIGDGLGDSAQEAGGFALDNAEWSRINSGSLSVFGLDGAGTFDMLIGKLDVTGPDAGSTIDDPAGTVLFRTGASPAAAPSGTIRVAGALEATGFRAGNALVFQAGQFQLASDTGSIAVLGKGGALSGAVVIAAQDIHVAATPLLTRLASDPFFAGVETALDNESAGGNGPVLRAGALDLTVGRTLYIQRSGTGADPLGFEDPLGGFKVDLAGASPITVIINGTFRTTSGLVGGIAAWQLFKDSGADLSGFTADSRLNGCLLTAATCGAVPQPEPQPDPDPGIRTLISVLDDPALDDTPSGDPEERDAKTANAILPPQTFLAVQPDALPARIDEPIAGSGNPALTGAGIGVAGGLSQ